MNILPLLTEAERYLVEKDVDRAAELYVQADEQCAGRSPLPMVGLARIALLTLKHEQARQILDAVLIKHPRSAEALTMRGLVEEASERLYEAMVFHSRALAVDATLAVAHVNLGRTYAQLKEWSSSAASYRLAIQHGATGTAVCVQYGTALFRANQPSEALKVLAVTVQKDPHHLDAILTLADVLVETGSLQLAAELLDNAVPRLPKEPLIASRRAAIALRQKDLHAAQKEAWRHTELAPKDEEAWLFAAVIDTMQLRFDTAEKALRQVLRLNPQNWRAHYHLGGLFDAIKDFDMAKTEYRAAIACDSSAWEPRNNLAIMLLEEGTQDALVEARTLLEGALRNQHKGDAVLVHYNLALACYRLGDAAGTRRAAQELLKRAPVDHPMAAEAQRVLKLAA